MLLLESNLTARQPRRAPHHVIRATTSEGLAQGPYVVARVGFEPVTLLMQGTELTTEPPLERVKTIPCCGFFNLIIGLLFLNVGAALYMVQ